MRQRKIVFFCIPAHGHTNPTLGVVRELISRGHQVWFYSYEQFRRQIEESGAHFVPCDAYDMEMKLTPAETAQLGNNLILSARVLVDTTLALDEMVCRDMERLHPDCIVADSMAVWGKAVAIKLGIPFVSSTTTFAFNRYSAKIMPQDPKNILQMLLSMPLANQHIRRLRKHDYPVKHILEVIGNDNMTHTIVYTSPEFQPSADTFSKEYYSFVGPSIRKTETSVVKQREKLIYISMGTVNNDMVPLYRACIDALTHTDYHVMISVGNLVDLSAFGMLPENISVYSHVDQIAVLQKADAFLSHCGMNSAMEGLYFGVPLIMNPKTPEQKGVAFRTSQLGAGLMLEKETPDAVLNAVSCVLTDPAFTENAHRISETFKSCSGAAGAADKIISLCI